MTVPNSILPLPTMLCHCNTCRHLSGTLFATLARLPKGTKPPDAILSSLETYQATDLLTRYFCRVCGTHMLLRSNTRDTYMLSTGSVEQVVGIFDIKEHIFIHDTIDGGASDWLPSISNTPLARHQGYNFSDQIAPNWSAPAHQELVSKPRPEGAQLHAHCSCGGVKSYVSQPSFKSTQTKSPWPDALNPYHDKGPSPADTIPWWLVPRPPEDADEKTDFSETKYRSSTCTCNSCRLGAGFELQAWAFIPLSNISMSPTSHVPFSPEEAEKGKQGTLKAYRSSDEATRWFCSGCGATIFWIGDVRPGLIDVSVGLFDTSEEGVRAERWLAWSNSRVSFKEDAQGRAKEFVDSFEDGLRAWGNSRKA